MQQTRSTLWQLTEASIENVNRQSVVSPQSWRSVTIIKSVQFIKAQCGEELFIKFGRQIPPPTHTHTDIRTHTKDGKKYF